MITQCKHNLQSDNCGVVQSIRYKMDQNDLPYIHPVYIKERLKWCVLPWS